MASQEVTAIVEKYRTCVDEAVAVTTPELIPDAAVRKIAFETLVEGCNDLKDVRLAGLSARQRSAAADARAEEITRSIIEGAKAEIDIGS